MGEVNAFAQGKEDGLQRACLLNRIGTGPGMIAGNPDAPVGQPDAFDDHITATCDPMNLAYQVDTGRVFPSMTGHEGIRGRSA